MSISIVTSDCFIYTLQDTEKGFFLLHIIVHSSCGCLQDVASQLNPSPEGRAAHNPHSSLRSLRQVGMLKQRDSVFSKGNTAAVDSPKCITMWAACIGFCGLSKKRRHKVRKLGGGKKVGSDLRHYHVGILQFRIYSVEQFKINREENCGLRR